MNKQDIARLIIHAYNAGKEEGQSIGYETGYAEGYEEAYDRAFTAGQEDGMAQVAGIDEEGKDEKEEWKEWSSAQWYDAGWCDGYNGSEPDEDMKEDRVYMWGYNDGAKEESK
jgi:hypothetical protein